LTRLRPLLTSRLLLGNGLLRRTLLRDGLTLLRGALLPWVRRSLRRLRARTAL
jgi:hypothetical protein